MRIAAIVLLVGVFHCAFGQTNTNALVAGDWSAPIADKGRTLRGRLWVGEGPVYLELEHVVTIGWDQPVQIYFDIFSGLQFEMHDGSGKSIRPQQVMLCALAPLPYWVTLPCDATVRLRADIDIGRSMEILVADGEKGAAQWLLLPTPTNDYFLSCTFTPSTNRAQLLPLSRQPALGYQVWQGTLKLPMVKIPVKKP